MDDMVSKGRWAVNGPRDLRRGETHGATTLTNDLVLRFRAEYAGGATQRDLARRYAVPRGTMIDILKGRSWRHLPLTP